MVSHFFHLQIGREAAIRTRCRDAASAAQRRGPRLAPPLEATSLASEAARYRLHELWFLIYFRLEIGREAAIRARCRVAA